MRALPGAGAPSGDGSADPAPAPFAAAAVAAACRQRDTASLSACVKVVQYARSLTTDVDHQWATPSASKSPPTTFGGCECPTAVHQHQRMQHHHRMSLPSAVLSSCCPLKLDPSSGGCSQAPTRLGVDSLAGRVRRTLGSSGLPPGRVLSSGVAPSIGVGVAVTAAPLAAAPPAAVAGVGGLLGSSWWHTGTKLGLGVLQHTVGTARHSTAQHRQACQQQGTAAVQAA